MKIQALLLLILVSRAFASPVVIATLGPTTPIQLGPSPQEIMAQAAHTPIPAMKATMRLMPMTTKMTVSLFDRHKLVQKSPVALFVIGSDEVSTLWLEAHKQQLEKLHAVGMIVQADNISDLKRLADKAKPLQVMPANGDLIQKAYGVDHYPALIAEGWVSQ